jgi:NTE family protein
MMKKIGLALGGGGAKGLAHVPLLEVLDEAGVKLHVISGTSIGSIMGALYASGMSGAEIREGLDRIIIARGDSIRDLHRKKDAFKILSFIDLEFSRGGLLKSDKFIEYLYGNLGSKTFEELTTPLKIVATDFWSNEQVILEEGELLPAIQASMGLPGVFTPVVRNERVLIDGGGVNPVPHDILQEECDLVIAIDVMGTRKPSKHPLPNVLRAVLHTFDIMQNSIIAQRIKANPPDILIRPDVENVEILEFDKAPSVYRQAAPAAEHLRRELERVL